MAEGNAEGHRGGGGGDGAHAPGPGHATAAPHAQRLGPVVGLGRLRDGLGEHRLADGRKNLIAHLGRRRNLGQEALEVRQASLLGEHAVLRGRRRGAEGRVEGGRLFGVEHAQRVEDREFDEIDHVHAEASSTALSRKRTSALLRADFTVPMGVSNSSPICRSVCPPRYARITTRCCSSGKVFTSSRTSR